MKQLKIAAQLVALLWVLMAAFAFAMPFYYVLHIWWSLKVLGWPL